MNSRPTADHAAVRADSDRASQAVTHPPLLTRRTPSPTPRATRTRTRVTHWRLPANCHEILLSVCVPVCVLQLVPVAVVRRPGARPVPSVYVEFFFMVYLC